MNKLVAIALLAVGTILIIYGASSSGSVGSNVSRMFTGAPMDRTIWLMAGGVAAALVGVVGLLGSSKSG
jgi:hypothetical protein